MPSTVIKHFHYDPAQKQLAILFTSGERYAYFDVPENVAVKFRAAYSKGRFFSAHIRDHYRFEKIQED